jgi:hypothetical protein
MVSFFFNIKLYFIYLLFYPYNPFHKCLEHRLSIHTYKAHCEEYMKDMDRKWKEGAAERQRLQEEMKKRPKIVIPQVNYTAEDENWDD